MYRDQDQHNFARRLRNEPTAAEKLFWHFLRGGKRLGCPTHRMAGVARISSDPVPESDF